MEFLIMENIQMALYMNQMEKKYMKMNLRIKIQRKDKILNYMK
jgi:hypothetical protein